MFEHARHGISRADADDFAEDSGVRSESFEEFFGDDASAEFGEFEPSEFSEDIFAEFIEGDPEWAEIHEAGFGLVDVAREAYPELSESDDWEVIQFVEEITESMSPEEVENFFRKLKNFGKKALRIAAPIVQTAAPIVGAALGGPLGGVVGNLVGTGLGAAAQRVGRGRATRRRPGRHIRRRPRGRRRRAMPRRRGGGGAGRQLMSLLNNPQIKSALLNLANRGVGAIVGRRGETMAESAALVGVIEGVRRVLAEAQEAGHDLDFFEGDLAPADFESAEDAFDAVVELLEIDG